MIYLVAMFVSVALFVVSATMVMRGGSPIHTRILSLFRRRSKYTVPGYQVLGRGVKGASIATHIVEATYPRTYK